MLREGETAEGYAGFDLDELARANRLRSWMFEQYESRAHGQAVEVGPGLGTFTERLLQYGVERLHLIEPDPLFADFLERHFDGDPRVSLARERLPHAPSLANGDGKWDFILCQNVLEHIADDRGAVQEMARALRVGGTLTILVPAGPKLYGALDRSFGHHRRYTRERLCELVGRAGLRLDELYAFNMLGILGWWIKNRTGATSLGPLSLRAYETLVPVWRAVEQLISPTWGLSLIAHARK
jgi:SAM-dependent methyltransferase